MSTQPENETKHPLSDFSFETEKDVAFVVPLSFDLGENGTNIALKSFCEAGIFAAQEIKIWSDIIGNLSSDKPFIQKIIDVQLQTPRSIYNTAIEVLKNQISASEGFTIIRKDLNAYLSFKCLHSQGTLGQMAMIM